MGGHALLKRSFYFVKTLRSLAESLVQVIAGIPGTGDWRNPWYRPYRNIQVKKRYSKNLYPLIFTLLSHSEFPGFVNRIVLEKPAESVKLNVTYFG